MPAHVQAGWVEVRTQTCRWMHRQASKCDSSSPWPQGRTYLYRPTRKLHTTTTDYHMTSLFTLGSPAILCQSFCANSLSPLPSTMSSVSHVLAGLYQISISTPCCLNINVLVASYFQYTHTLKGIQGPSSIYRIIYNSGSQPVPYNPFGVSTTLFICVA